MYIQNISTAAEYTFFSDLHGTLSRMNQILSHETSLNKAKNTVIMSSIFLTTVVWNQKPVTGGRWVCWRVWHGRALGGRRLWEVSCNRVLSPREIQVAWSPIGRSWGHLLTWQLCVSTPCFLGFQPVHQRSLVVEVELRSLGGPLTRQMSQIRWISHLLPWLTWWSSGVQESGGLWWVLGQWPAYFWNENGSDVASLKIGFLVKHGEPGWDRCSMNPATY